MSLSKLRESFLHLLYPELCVLCKSVLSPAEPFLCLACEFNLPRYEENGREGHSLAKTFWGRVPFRHTAAFLRLQHRSKANQIIHEIKYKENRALGHYMGCLLGRMTDSQYSNLKYPFDVLLPVPLHPKKLAQRGYNQSQIIAEGIQEVLQIPIASHVVDRVHYNSSQTKKDRSNRWLDSKGLFELTASAAELEDKHIVLVDDVVTTGATAESVCMELLKIKGVKLSLFSLGYSA